MNKHNFFDKPNIDSSTQHAASALLKKFEEIKNDSDTIMMSDELEDKLPVDELKIKGTGAILEAHMKKDKRYNNDTNTILEEYMKKNNLHEFDMKDCVMIKVNNNVEVLDIEHFSFENNKLILSFDINDGDFFEELVFSKLNPSHSSYVQIIKFRKNIIDRKFIVKDMFVAREKLDSYHVTVTLV